MPNKQIKWIDLSEYGLKLLAVKLPSGNSALVFLGADKISETALEMGFKKIDNGGYWITQYSSEFFAKNSLLLKTAFPNLKIIETDQDNVFRYLGNQLVGDQLVVEEVENTPSETKVSKPKKKRVAEPPLEVILARSKYMGLNRLAQEVYEGIEGRFIKEKSGKALFESEFGDSSPPLFLRAPNNEDLNMCADGFIEEGLAGHILRFNDLTRFTSAVNDEENPTDDKIMIAFNAIESAQIRACIKQKHQTMRETFGGAIKLHESHIYFSDIAKLQKQEFSSIPLPVSVVLQRLIGSDTDLHEKNVKISSSGSGATFAFLSKTANITVYENDPELYNTSLATGKMAGFTNIKYGEPNHGDPNHDISDFLISNLKRKKYSGEINGLSLKRSDHYDLLSALGERSDEGRAIFILDGADTKEDEKEIDEVETWIAQNYAIEGISYIDSATHSGRHGQTDKRIVVIGSKRPESVKDQKIVDIARRKTKINNFTALWAWSAEVLSNRAKIAKWHSEITGNTFESEEEGEDFDYNIYQAPYASASNIAPTRTMVPKNLEGVTNDALSKVVKKHGDIDEYVSTALAMTKEQMFECISSEQVDAIGLCMHAHENNRGFLLADQTGIGKGRTLACLARASVLQGKKVLFVTERAVNLSDFWRDIKHVQSENEFSPFIVNNKVNIIDDVNDEIIMKSKSIKDINKVMESREWPEDSNFIMATYSQFNRNVDDSLKSEWLLSVLDEDTVVILDESHNAASSKSNTGKNFVKALENTNNVIYSSATFAKNATNMDAYNKLFPDDIKITNLAETLKKGGETLQEVMSSMLVQDGVMIRREHDLSNAEFVSIYDEKNFERNRQYMDRLAPVISEMARLSGEIGFKKRDYEQDNPVETLNRIGVTHMGFGSPLYNLARMFSVALKVDVVTDMAINDLKNGDKPVFLFESTNEILLKEMLKSDDPVVAPDFKSFLHRTLNQMTRMKQRIDPMDPESEFEYIDLTERHPELEEPVNNLKAMIDEFPDLPISPMDIVAQKIEEAGFTCGEISGRKIHWDGKEISDREIEDKAITVNKFNSGVTDALNITLAGCTGISIHAGARFADQRKRKLYVVEDLGDPMRLIQAYGRVNRFDQVQNPIIARVNSGLPVEMRFEACMNSKLRRLSANVTSNRESPNINKSIPDILNSVGDQVCYNYAESRPDIMDRLGLERSAHVEDINENEAVGGNDSNENKRTANQFLSRLFMLPWDQQEQIIAELNAEFEACIEELDSKGINPLRSKTLSGTVSVESETVFEGADIDNQTSVFHDPVYLQQVNIERTQEPIKSQEVAIEVDKGMALMMTQRPEVYIDKLTRKRNDYLHQFLPENVFTVEQALADGVYEVVELARKFNEMIEVLKEIKPGSEIIVSSHDGIAEIGIVTGLKMAERGFEGLASKYNVDFIVPGDIVPRRLKLGTLLKDKEFKVLPGLNGDEYDVIMSRFNTSLDNTKVIKSTIFSGNLFRATELALQHKLGSVVSYLDKNNVRNRGVSIARKFSNLEFLPVNVSSSKMALDAISYGAEIRGGKDLKERSIIISQAKDSSYSNMVYLPSDKSRKWNYIYQKPLLQEKLKQFYEEKEFDDKKIKLFKGNPKFTVDDQELELILNDLYDLNVQFCMSGRYRSWANDRNSEEIDKIDEDVTDIAVEDVVEFDDSETANSAFGL